GSAPATPDDRIVSAGVRRHRDPVAGIELPVTVAEQPPRLARRCDARDHSAAVAAIMLVMDRTDVGIRCGKPIGDLAGAIAAPVIDYDYFVIACDARQDR